MHICLECGQIFAVPGHNTDFYEGWGEQFSHTYECCPACGGAFEEAQKCPVCDDVYLDTEDEYICGKCFESAGLPEIVKFYESTGELNTLIDELNTFAEKDLEVLFSRVACGFGVSPKTLDNLTEAWKQCSLNVLDFKKYLAEEAKERRIKK